MRNSVLLAILALVTISQAKTIVPATDAKIRYIGRFDMSSPAAPRMPWPGTQVIASFEGSSIGVIISESRDSGSCFDVFVDGQARPKLITRAQIDTYTVATGLSSGTHTLILYKRTESDASIPSFKGLVLDDGKGLADLPSPSLRRIEFIGDSHTAGLVNEAPNFNAVNITTHNAYKSYAAVAARYFGADYHLTAVSGKGLVHNHSDTVEQSAVTMRHYFRRTIPSSAAPEWNFPSWTPQVVVVNLGTNDFAECFQVSNQWDAWRKPVRGSVFTPAYRSFLDTIRATYPGAKIVCMGPYDFCGCKDSAAKVIQSAVAAEKAAGKTDIAYCAYPIGQASDFTACHPTPAYAARIADSLKKTITSLTGWGDSTTATGVRQAPKKDSRRGLLLENGKTKRRIVSLWRSHASDASLFDMRGRRASFYDQRRSEGAHVGIHVLGAQASSCFERKDE